MSYSIDSSQFISHFFFKKDKNYILKEAQLKSSDELCRELFNQTIKAYNAHFNPLGIQDDTSIAINAFQLQEISPLKEIYENLAAVYRYQYSDSQLEIIWDGRSQMDKFTGDWTLTYSSWIEKLCTNKSFIKGMLQLTVFGDKKNLFFIENHLKGIINEFFELKVLIRNGSKRVYVKMPQMAKAS